MRQAAVGGTAGPAAAPRRGGGRALRASARAALTSSVIPAIEPAIEAMSAGTITVRCCGESASLAKASTYFWATK